MACDAHLAGTQIGREMSIVHGWMCPEKVKSKSAILVEKQPFCVFESLLGLRVNVRYVHLRLIRKRVVDDFLLVLTELSLLGAIAEALRTNID